MPTTINGIGTHYYGKRNLEKETGVCESCGNYAELQTYETTLFFVVIFVPLIPLGRKQIIDDCSICRRHKVLPVSQWQQIREQAIESSQTQLAEKMGDPKAAIEHMQTLTAFQQKDEAKDLSGILEKTHAEDFDVQFFLGVWHEKYGTAEDSDRCFEKAFQIDPKNPVAIRAKAVGLMEKGQPEDAEALLEDFKHPSEYYDPTLFYTLAGSYQAANQHDRAIELFSELIEQSPGIEKEKPFRESVRKSEKATFRPDSILPKKSLLSSTGFRWAAGIALLLIGLVFWNYYIATNRTLRVVNGIDQAITVTIDDGDSTTVQPRSHRDVKISEGSHSVSYQDAAGHQKTGQVDMGISFFQRYFSRPSFVLNPTKTAFIFKQTTVYSAAPVTADDAYEVRIGELLTQIDHSDFGFGEFPGEIEMPSKTSQIPKSRVGYMPFNGALLFSDLVKATPDEKMQVFEDYLRYDSGLTDLSMYLALAELNQRQDRCLEYMESRLDQNPVNVQLHRMYQTLAEREGASKEQLIERYEGYLAKHAGDTNYLYLRGRLEDTVSETRKFMDDALQADAGNSFAHGAIAFGQMTTGEYADAAASYQRATELAPENLELKSYYLSSLFASQQYDKIEPLIKLQPESLYDFEVASNYLKASGKESQRDALKNSLLTKNVDDEQLAIYADLHWDYLNQDHAAYATKIEKLTDSTNKDMATFKHAIETADYEKARESLVKLEYAPDSDYSILLAILQHRVADKQAAMKAWQTLVENIGKGFGPDRPIAPLIEQSADREIGSDEFLQLSLNVPRKKMMALAMKEFGCKVDADWNEMISKLNFNLEFPHNFVESCLK